MGNSILVMEGDKGEKTWPGQESRNTLHIFVYALEETVIASYLTLSLITQTQNSHSSPSFDD